MSTPTPLYASTLSDIASNIGLPLHIIEAWAERGDIKLVAAGLYENRWPTWLAIGRTATAWRRDIPAKTAVAVGWLAEFKRLGRTPAPANLKGFREMFERQGHTAADADQALATGAAHV